MKQILKNRKGAIPVLGWIAIIIAVVVFGAIGFSMIPQTQTGGDGVVETSVSCPSDQTWTGTVSVQNLLNDTGAETFDTTMNFYTIKADGSQDELSYNEIGAGGFSTSITDTTSGSATLSCGKRYAVKILSTSGAGGDPSLVRSIVSQSSVADAKVNADGVFVFTARDNSGAFTLGVHQVGNIAARVFDFVEGADYIYCQDCATKTEWNATDAANWTSTTNNLTSVTVGSGGEYHVRLETRAVVNDQNVNDRGIYVLVNANTGTWGSPIVKINGVNAVDIIDSGLNPDETKAYSAYEYAYLIGRNTPLTNKEHVDVDMDIFALGGQNPAGNTLDIDLSPIGSYASVSDANNLKVGSVDDSSSRTQVYTLQDETFAVV